MHSPHHTTPGPLTPEKHWCPTLPSVSSDLLASPAGGRQQHSAHRGMLSVLSAWRPGECSPVEGEFYNSFYTQRLLKVLLGGVFLCLRVWTLGASGGHGLYPSHPVRAPQGSQSWAQWQGQSPPRAGITADEGWQVGLGITCGSGYAGQNPIQGRDRCGLCTRQMWGRVLEDLPLLEEAIGQVDACGFRCSAP